MKKFFEQQYDYSNPITEELLREMPMKKYESGLEKIPGDVQLHAFETEFETINEEGKEELSLNLISLCEREFKNYELTHTIVESGFNEHLKLPILIKKGDEGKFQSHKKEFSNNLENE